MMIKKETLLKAQILSRGVEFTYSALIKARDDNAKGQNLVYNMPLKAESSRPQELLIKSEGYSTVASCVAASGDREAVKIDINKKGQLLAIIDDIVFEGVELTYLKKPDYYNKKLANGESVKKYVSACGYDELNILPWKGCAISKGCKFCGVNTVAKKNMTDLFNAYNLSQNPDIWKMNKREYIGNLKKSIKIALEDECYDEHVHLIMISGNLSDDRLDMQTDIFSDIAEGIKEEVKGRTTEGIIAVITPPDSLSKLVDMKNSGIDIVVFNLEVGNEPWFSKYCPGKRSLGKKFFIERLLKAVDIYGYGKVWTNFVFGLEPADSLLKLCEKLAQQGIVTGANILHLDQGNQLDCSVPTVEDSLRFFYELSKIYRKYNFKPFYCAKALRTSLANEAFEGRITF